ncbi:MAG: hypothetical protein ACOX2Q_00875 [Dehalobacterium sp.]
MKREEYACYNWIMVDYTPEEKGEKYTSLIHESKEELVKFLTKFTR